MEAEYDFSNSRPNPYSDQLRQEVILKLDVDTLAYFQRLAEQTGIPSQNLMNTYLVDCAVHQRFPTVLWH